MDARLSAGDAGDADAERRLHCGSMRGDAIQLVAIVAAFLLSRRLNQVRYWSTMLSIATGVGLNLASGAWTEVTRLLRYVAG